MGKGPRTITPRDNVCKLKTVGASATCVHVADTRAAHTHAYAATNHPISSRCAHIVESFQLSRNCVLHGRERRY